MYALTVTDHAITGTHVGRTSRTYSMVPARRRFSIAQHQSTVIVLTMAAGASEVETAVNPDILRAAVAAEKLVDDVEGREGVRILGRA